MKLPSIHNKLVNVNITKYRIDWKRKVSDPQLQVKNFLFSYWKHDIILEEFLIPSSLFRIDIINLTKKIVVEVSPNKLHLEFNKFFHGTRAAFLKKIKADSTKLFWAEKAGYIFIELYDEDIENLSVCLFKEKFGVDL